MPLFSKFSVESNRPDGYWIESFPPTAATAAPDLIGYGLGTSQNDSEIQHYYNPLPDATATASWSKHKIAKLRFPVACTYGDIAGKNRNDVILSDEYGPSMDDINANGGRVSWFENTGSTSGDWPRRYIGRSPGMHRLKAGHFTRADKLQIIAAPIIIKSSDLESPAPIIIYTKPDQPTSRPVDDDKEGWESEVPFPNSFRLVHEVFVVSRGDGKLDHILLAGREGITLIWYDDNKREWKSQNLGTGLERTANNPYWGSESVAVGKSRDDHTAYIASSEAFHGNHVSVYIKPTSAPKNQLANVQWTRVVLENFGPLNEKHTGSIHQVVCADVDGDGVDEILVALMGSDPPSWEKTGVWCYKPIDLARGTFSSVKLTNDSAGRIAVGHFSGRGVVDLATISYSVPGYFESPNPSVNVYHNCLITAQRLNDEVLFLIPNPSTLDSYTTDEVEFLDVSGKKLTLVVVGADGCYTVDKSEGIKVISGQVSWSDKKGILQTRTPAADPFSVVSNIVSTSESVSVHVGSSGAAFMLLKQSTTSGAPPYPDMKKLKAHNVFPARFSEEVRHMKFDWVKVEDRPWANGRFKGLEFYNLVGFHVRMADDSLKDICHIQMWTAGVGVSAGFHNHIDAAFCEIHSCIVNGTGEGGMSWATVADDDFDPAHPDKEKYKSIVVPDMHEHGPLWRTTDDGLPKFRTNATVDYPWHAWMAGKEETQSFDVWVAFEFPPLLTRTLRVGAVIPSPGVYNLINDMFGKSPAVQGGDSTDGTPIIGVKSNPHHGDQQWKMSSIPGISAMVITNVASKSSATSNWPPVPGQQLVGSRSPALLGITSNWIVLREDYEKGEFMQVSIPNLCGLRSYALPNRIGLIGTDLVWTLDQNYQIVLRQRQAGEGRQIWRLQAATA